MIYTLNIMIYTFAHNDLYFTYKCLHQWEILITILLSLFLIALFLFAIDYLSISEEFSLVSKHLQQGFAVLEI
jgi:hypothetical protein